MARHTSDLDPWSWSDQRAAHVDDAPRWLVVAGAAAGIAVTLALLRYAIDLLGVVFVIVLVGTSIRTLTDWLTDSDGVSPWSIAAVFISLFGTAVVGLWLFESSAARAAGRLEQRMPSFMVDAIDWAEARGWGHRVLLVPPPDDDPKQRRARRSAGDFLPSPDRATPPPPRSAAVVRSERTASAEAPAADHGAAFGVAGSTGTAEVRSYATLTTLTVTPREVNAGQSVHLNAVVESEPKGSPLPEGTVVFRRDTVVLEAVLLRVDGARSVARLTIVAVPVGTHGLLAEYAGNQRFRTSRSEPVPLVINP